MFQSYLDGFSLIDVVPENYTEMNVSQAYLIWTTAARQIWLNVFAPSNRAQSLLRPSLLANKLDVLSIVYAGTVLLHYFQLMVRLMEHGSQYSCGRKRLLVHRC